MRKTVTGINAALVCFALVASCSGQTGKGTRKNSSKRGPDNSGIVTHPEIIRTKSVTSGNISCELCDLNGHLWFSTGGEGVYRFDGKSFTNFTKENGLSDNNTSSIIQDKYGNILIGTDKGICKFDGKVFGPYFSADTLRKMKIISLLEDRDGNLWIGVMNRGIYRYDGKTLSGFLFRYEHPFLGTKQEKYVSDILQDSKGNIWFSSFNRGGAWRYDGKTLVNFLPSTDYYRYNENENLNTEASVSTAFTGKYTHSPAFITDDMITAITEDRDGNIWFATRRHGACRYDGKTFENFDERKGFVSYGIRSICQDQKGNIWFGTGKNGAFCYDGKTFRNFTTEHGLVNNSVFSIIEDRGGNIWFGTRWFGLSRYDGRSFTTFSEYQDKK